MPAIKSFVTGVLRHLPHYPRSKPRQYVPPISRGDLTGEYLLIEIPELPSQRTERVLTALLAETHRNGFTVGLTDREGYPSLFPPGADRFDADGSAGRLQNLVSVLDRFTQVFHRSETDVIVLNAARIEENVRIATSDPGKSGEIARANLDALGDCLSALSEDRYRFANSDAVPEATRDSHLVSFKESVLYR